MTAALVIIGVVVVGIVGFAVLVQFASGAWTLPWQKGKNG